MASNLLDTVWSIGAGLFSPASASTRDAHLLGQHTVRMSPISTAQLNPNAQTFCLAPNAQSLLIPVLLNNTNPMSLRYSISPLGYTLDGSHSQVEYVDLTAKDIKAIEQSWVENLEVRKLPPTNGHQSDDYDAYDDDFEDSEETHNKINPTLQTTQSLIHIRVNKPGVVRLERILDVSSVDARLAHPSEVMVVPCPRVGFTEHAWPQKNIRCAGDNKDLQLMIEISGTPPLTLRWSQTTNGRQEQFLVEGIEGGPEDSSPKLAERSIGGAPQRLLIPLTVSPNVAGTYVYALQEVSDSVGNIVRLDPETNTHDTLPPNSNTTRSLRVLQQSTVAFKHCGPGSSAPLLIGSDAPLVITTNVGDSLDGPWEVELQYRPTDELARKVKPWKKKFETQGNKRDLVALATTPGEYTITSVKGKV